MGRHSATAVKRRSAIRRREKKQRRRLNQEHATSEERGYPGLNTVESECSSLFTADSIADCSEQASDSEIIEDCYSVSTPAVSLKGGTDRKESQQTTKSPAESSIDYILPNNISKKLAARFTNRLNMRLDTFYDKDPLAAAFCDLNATLYRAAFIKNAANLSKATYH